MKTKKVYKFEDLMAVRKAALLTSKVLDEELASFRIEEFIGGRGRYLRHRFGLDFISLERFSSYYIYFKALCPGLTKDNMKDILRDIRKRRQEFVRRIEYRKSIDHTYEEYVKTAVDVELHSLIEGRLYPLSKFPYYSSGNYNPIIRKLALRKKMQIEEARVKLMDRFWGGVPSPVNKVRTELIPKGQAFYTNLIISNHSKCKTLAFIYKTREGRAGIAILLQIPKTYRVENDETPHLGNWRTDNIPQSRMTNEESISIVGPDINDIDKDRLHTLLFSKHRSSR